MRNFIIFTRFSPSTYGLVSTLVSRGCVPQAIVFEDGIHETVFLKILRFTEELFLWAEHKIFFRRHTYPHEYYRRFGSLSKLVQKYAIELHFVENHNDSRTEALLREKAPTYLLLCGTRFIKPHILAIPKSGTLNAHSAMLPHYRGAKSEYWILSEKNYDAAGVTIHWVDEKLDTGAICLQEHIVVVPNETMKTLRAKALFLLPHLFAETLRRLESGEALSTPQSAAATYKRPDHVALVVLEAELLQRDTST